MGLSIDDTAPGFDAGTTQGRIRFHEWTGDSWAVLFSRPAASRRCARPSSVTWPSWRRDSRDLQSALPGMPFACVLPDR
jgi:hypothetical protein